ncbi:DMT family transporter [Corynebacterium confusum]|uniref:DMT family transporter n=1 Tax=Corynebacterium confusum TaxID=71254 RepID=UPI0025B5CE98|nr:multidrug efflux SMR transporter [Corynebacterium confusum]WJY88695.1 Multidrug resistance protein EbrB [Corynebacterium confusum]
MSWAYIILAVLCEVAGTMSLRMSAVRGGRWWLLAVIAGYVAAYVFLSLALLEGMALGVAYGIWSAVGVALTAVLSFLFFKEPFTWLKSLGVALIIGGVLLVEMGA